MPNTADIAAQAGVRAILEDWARRIDDDGTPSQIVSAEEIRAALAAIEPQEVAEPASEQCERCQGNGEIVTDWDRYKHPQHDDVGDEAVAECPDCDGIGRVPVTADEKAVEEPVAAYLAAKPGDRLRAYFTAQERRTPDHFASSLADSLAVAEREGVQAFSVMFLLEDATRVLEALSAPVTASDERAVEALRWIEARLYGSPVNLASEIKEAIRAAIRSQPIPTGLTDWVNCPVCGEQPVPAGYVPGPVTAPPKAQHASDERAAAALQRAKTTLTRYHRAGLGDDVFHSDLTDTLRIVDAALAAAPKAQPVQGWQDSVAAPLDEFVLVRPIGLHPALGEPYLPTVARCMDWSGARRWYAPENEIDPIEFGEGVAQDELPEALKFKGTEWMPLPAGPSSKEGQ